MGVSFKVAKTGTRYRPKVLQIEDRDRENDTSTGSPQRENEGDLVRVGDQVADHSNSLAKPGLLPVSENLEVSFSLNLFRNGFSVGKATELFSDEPKMLHPYDRASETLFSAIEYGCLPGDLFDDIPSKYVNGALLCEIRDYRNYLPHKGDAAASASKSPTAHKVLLQMCMENVVKDVSLISQDSWTYEDLLEVESRILKALQPDLHLNPKPMLDRSIGESLTRKLNLEIAWSWKKRKLNDAPATSSQENNVVQETISQSFPLPSQSNYQLVPSCNQSVSTAFIPSKFVSAPKQCYTNSYSDLTIPSTLALGDRARCDMQAIQGPILKKPKEEPLEFSQFQLPGSQAAIGLAPDLQCKNKLVQQILETEKIQHESCNGNKHPSLSITNGQQAILECIPKLPAGMASCNLKQEPAETSKFLSSHVGKIKDNYLIMDVRNNQSKLQQLPSQQSSPLSRANVPPTSMQWNHIGQPADKNMRNGTLTQNRKALQDPQASTGVGSVPVGSCHRNFGPREASLSSKRKSKPRPKGSSMNAVGSRASTSNMNDINTNCSQVGNPCLPQPSVFHGDPLLERFSKIKMVTQRYGLNYRKRKLNQFLRKRPFSCTTPLVGFHLLNFEDNGNLKDTTTHGISLANCLIDRSLNVSKTRTLTFVQPRCVNQENKIPSVDSEDQKKLVITEKLHVGMVEASVLYGNGEKIDSFDFPLLPTFPSTHYADLFAAQFTSLMVREGYRISSDRIESTPLSIDDGSSSQRSSVRGSAPPAAGIAELTPATPIPGPSPGMLSPMRGSMSSLYPRQLQSRGLAPGMLSPMSGSMSSLNPRQLQSQNNPRQVQSQNILSGGHSLSLGNIQSAQQLPASYLYKSQLDIAAQVSSLQQPWNQIINKSAFLHFQMQQRQRQQLLQRELMMGGFGVAGGSLGAIQLGGGIQGLGNLGFGPFSDIMGMGGSMSAPTGHMPAIGYMGQFNNLGSNASSFNRSNQHFDSISVPSAAVLASQSSSESQGRVLMNGVSIQRNAGVAPLLQPNTPDMAFNLTDQHQQQLHVLPQQQQQELRSPFQPPEAASLDYRVDSHLSDVSLQQFNQQSQISLQQLSSGSVPVQTNAGNAVAVPESPELSSRTHGSMNSSNASSSLGLPGLTKDSSAVKTGRV